MEMNTKTAERFVPDLAPYGRWQRLSLANRFALAAGVVLALATWGIGAVVTGWIEEAVVRNSGYATAIYMDSVIAPITQQLAMGDELSPESKQALDDLFSNTPLGENVISYKFWRYDGLVIWAKDKSMIGRTFEPDDDLVRALAGEVVAGFDNLNAAENAAEAATGLPLIEVYSPIRAVWSGEVIAVAEFYGLALKLRDDLRAARRGAWAAVSATTLGLGAVLYAIVLGGSRTIETQRRALAAQLNELRKLSNHNTDLRLRVQAAAGRSATGTDQTLRRIGADLHDGPAQDLAYAALRLDALKDRLAGTPGETELDRVAQAVNGAMTEIRSLSRGLLLPDIAARPITDMIASAVEAHQVRTGHPVAVQIDDGPDLPLDPAARVALFRFVQEGLANASRHGGGAGLAVVLSRRPDGVEVAVRDDGPGLPKPLPRGGIGLAGLRDRIESLGGSFVARTRPGGGTELTMRLEV